MSVQLVVTCTGVIIVVDIAYHHKHIDVVSSYVSEGASVSCDEMLVASASDG